jgi:hypothetical protein
LGSVQALQTDSGSLERIVEQMILNLSKEPESTRLRIRSRRGLVLDGPCTETDIGVRMLERWSILTDWFFHVISKMLADLSEISEADRLLFEEASEIALAVARKADEAAAALLTRDEERFAAAACVVESRLGLS